MGNGIIHIITGEEILYFPIPHNTLCFPPSPPPLPIKFCISHRCEMFLGGLHIPKDKENYREWKTIHSLGSQTLVLYEFTSGVFFRHLICYLEFAIKRSLPLIWNFVPRFHVICGISLHCLRSTALGRQAIRESCNFIKHVHLTQFRMLSVSSNQIHLVR